MNLQDLRGSYQDYVKGLHRGNPIKSMELAVGGDFVAIGILERELLIQEGLQPDGYLIDVGCGSGRLAKPLTEFLRGRYLGTDVVPELIDHARALTQRADWRFEVIDAITIPERDAAADMVCFFSVFTHLLHEDSYRYLAEARRVLKPGGRVVFSFLDFKVPGHWSVFANDVSRSGGERPLNMFLSREAITVWAEHLQLRLEAMYDAHLPHIALRTPVTMENGTVQSGMGTLGQSVGVLVKTP